MQRKILVLGGYGNFGRLISENLAQREDITLIIAGRDEEKASNLCELLKAQGSRCQLTSKVLDVKSDNLLQELMEIRPEIVIHTCGPYQGLDYRVARACIKAGSHYIDLADDRRFVCDFHLLDEEARKSNVIAITGASSVSGLSSVAIDHHISQFAELEQIDFMIVPGSKVELGVATLKGILSYVGRPFQVWENRKHTLRYGWMDVHRMYLGETLGSRWLANINIPDLELFPIRYPGVNSVRFQAGHELGLVHLSLGLMAFLSRAGFKIHWENYADLMIKAGDYIKQLGSDCGGMVIHLTGRNQDGDRMKIIWRLIAKSGVGPRIPTIAAIILANHILDGKLTTPGARPCLGMFDLNEFFSIASKWGIYGEVERIVG